MNDRPAPSGGRAEELRQAFDLSFAEAPGVESAQQEELLAVRLGAAACALRLSEIRGVFADKKITRVPARHPALLGVASFRGAIVPVYSLPLLMGQTAGAAMRWLAIASDAAVAFAFEEVAGHVRVSRDAVIAGSAAQLHVSGFVRVQDIVRGVVNLRSVVAAIVKQASQPGS